MAELDREQNDINLSSKEEREAEKRGTPPATVVYETIREEGEHELGRPVSSLIWSGLAAGLSMGFSLVAEGLLQRYLVEFPWHPLISNFGYSAGFLIVILGRQQLFTENTLTVILPLLQQLNLKTLVRVARLWAAVLTANLVGAFLFAWVIAHTDIFHPEFQQAFSEIGHEAARSSGWLTTFLRAIFAGWLIALTVWLLPAAESGRIWIVIIMTYLVALGGYDHIIAGSVEIFYLTTTGQAPWSFYFGSWFLPALLGNIVGGVSLVAVLGHAQVINESQRSQPEIANEDDQ